MLCDENREIPFYSKYLASFESLKNTQKHLLKHITSHLNPLNPSLCVCVYIYIYIYIYIYLYIYIYIYFMYMIWLLRDCGSIYMTF